MLFGVILSIVSGFRFSSTVLHILISPAFAFMKAYNLNFEASVPLPIASLLRSLKFQFYLLVAHLIYSYSSIGF